MCRREVVPVRIDVGEDFVGGEGFGEDLGDGGEVEEGCWAEGDGGVGGAGGRGHG